MSMEGAAARHGAVEKALITLSPDSKMTQGRGFSFPNRHQGNAGAAEAHTGSLRAAPAACPCTHLPAAPESYREYGSGLVPKGVMVTPGWRLPAPPWPLLTLKEWVAHPLESPSSPRQGVKGAW